MLNVVCLAKLAAINPLIYGNYQFTRRPKCRFIWFPNADFSRAICDHDGAVFHVGIHDGVE